MYTTSQQVKQHCGVLTMRGYPAKFFYGQSIFQLAPRGDMLKMGEQQYDLEFNKILSKLDAKDIYKQIEALSGGRDVALLCFERAGSPCHRRMVAEWLEQHLGIEVKEYEVNLTKAN